MSAFRSFPSFIFAAAALTAALRAQTAAPAPTHTHGAGKTPAASAAASGHSHTPAPGSHAQAIVTLDQFVTSASPVARNQVDLAQATTVLSGQALLLKQKSSLGETLAGEAGMSSSWFGPGASRPVIRGLDGDRIRVLENSVGTLDASVTSPDHAVSVEPMLIERVEVLRGPASLLYGSNAVGGVVNVITHRIETDLPKETLRGGVEVRGNTGANEFSRGGVLDLALKPAAERALVFHVDAFRRETRDVRIPGYAESARVRAEEIEEAIEHGEAPPDFARGRLPNSALDNGSGAVGVSFVSPTFHVGASYSGYDSNYGVPGHAHSGGGTRIDLRQRRTDLQGEWHGESAAGHGAGPFHGARFKVGHARYRHVELESDGSVGTVFTNRGHEGRVELLHGNGQPWSGALGTQFSGSDFDAAGAEAFLPASDTRTAALFAFEEIATGAVSWQVGGRLERTRISPSGSATRSIDEGSASAGVVWKFDPAHAFAFSLTHTGRAPNAQELFANGPHAGTQSFEIGDRSLDSEKSLGFEASLRRRTGAVTGAVTFFANRFRGYLFAAPTGELGREIDGEWEILPAGEDDDDHDADSAVEAFPVYRYTQRDARFHGAELEAIWHVHDRSNWQLDLKLGADITRATAGGQNLPRIPPARITTGALWATAGWSAGVEAQFVFAQRRTAPAETRTDPHTLISAHLMRTMQFGHLETEFFLRATNVTNEEARVHASFVKELAPLPGRSVTAGVLVMF
jgi:iron complex outermembrane receptor protein